MKLSANITKATVFLGLGILIVAYLYFSSPGKLVVDEAGDVEGLTNKARAILQGKSFWKDQLREVTSDLQQELSEPQRKAQLDREMNQGLRKFDQSMEEMYREHPDLRPSPEERLAQVLRDRADEIEQAESDRFLEKIRLKRIAELRKILPVVQAKGG
jgi:hypothetical protein